MVTQRGVMLRSRALAERPRTVLAVMGEYLGLPSDAPDGPGDQDVCDHAPVLGPRLGLHLQSAAGCGTGDPFLHRLVLVALLGVATWMSGRCAATHIIVPLWRCRRTNIQGV